MIVVEVHFFKFRNWREDIDIGCKIIPLCNVCLNYCIPMNHRPSVIINVVLDDMDCIYDPKTSTVSNKGQIAAKGLQGGQYSKMHWRTRLRVP